MRSVPISATRVHLAVNRNPQTQYIHVLGLESCDSCDWSQLQTQYMDVLGLDFTVNREETARLTVSFRLTVKL